jgi:GH24 family phage-related lysozyme (muramidase)
MAAVKAPTGSTKPALYKMVSLPSAKMATGVKKSSGSQAVASSYGAFLTSINRLGGTVNSMIIVNQQILKTLVEGLKLKGAELDDMKKSFQKEKANKGKQVQKEGSIDWASKFAGFAVTVASDFFQGLAQLGQFFMRAFLGQAILRWISDPKNGEKLAKIVNGVIKIFQWLYKFITENLFKAIEGLVDMFDSDKSLWDRIKGFGNFIVGFGSLLLGMAFLKKPLTVIKAFKWVLETLWNSLSKSKKSIGKQAKALNAVGTGAAAANAKGGFGAWSAEQSAKAGDIKAKPRGRAGAVLGGLALLGGGMALGSMMSGGGEAKAPPAPQSGSLQGATDKAQTPSAESNIPFAAEGGVFTKPTPAIVGERGPEVRMPLSVNMPIPADNDQRRKDAGIKPLSSLGGMFGGNKQDGAKSDPKQASNLSKLFMAPFKGIGAGIIANITQTVGSLGPAGAAITPLVGSIIAPIANSFGVPPTVVKSAQGKQKTPTSEEKKKGKPSILDKLFGKGKSVSIPKDQKKYNKKGDTTVLGLLTDLLGAALVIGNKVGKSSGTSTGGPGPTKSDGTGGGKADTTIGDSVARGLEGKQGAGTETDAQMVGRSSKGVLDYIKSQDKGSFKDKTIRLSSGILNSPSDLKSVEEQLKYLKEAGAKVQLVGVPTNNPKFAPLNNKLKELAKQYGASWMGGYEAGQDGIHPKDYTTLKAKFDTEVKDAKISKDQSIDKNYGMKVGDEREFTASDGNNYKAHKTKEGFKFFRTGVAGAMDTLGGFLTGQQDRIPVDTKDAKNTFLLLDWQKSEGGTKQLPKAQPQAPKKSGGGPLQVLDGRSNGGWIDGPMSGYPVSLDGGRSIAFEGHGKEWVGFKKASGGQAFVVPFNTPATKGSPNLTNRRLREAKSGGYALPNFSIGGPKAFTSVYRPSFSFGGTTLIKKADGGFAKAVNWLKSHEGYREEAYWDVNAYRVGYGSDTQTKSDGKVVGVTKGYKTTKDDAERDLARRTKAFYDGAKKAVGEGWSKLDDNAHAALTSLAYNYGSVPSSVIKAAKTGDKEALAKAIEARATDDAGVNKKRRISEANLVRGKVQVSSSGVQAPGDSPNKEGDGEKTEEQSKEEQVKGLISKIAEDIVKLNTTGLGGDQAAQQAQIQGAGVEAGKAAKEKLTPQKTNQIVSASFTGQTGAQLTQATESVRNQKDIASDTAQRKINSAAAAAFSGVKPSPTVNKAGAQSQPIILPGPSKSLPIEAFNSPTSMIQYGWKFNL